MRKVYYSITQREFFRRILDYIVSEEENLSTIFSKNIIRFEKKILINYKKTAENSNLSKRDMCDIKNDLLNRHVKLLSEKRGIKQSEVHEAYHFVETVMKKILKRIPPPGRVDYRLTSRAAERDIRRIREEILEKIWLLIMDAKLEADFLRYRCFSFLYEYIEDFPSDYENTNFYLKTLTSFIRGEFLQELQLCVYIHPDDAEDILSEGIAIILNNSILPVYKLP